MERNLLRTSDLLLSDVILRGTSKHFEIQNIVLNRNGNVTGLIVSSTGIISIGKFVSLKNIDKLGKKQTVIKNIEKLAPKRIRPLNYCVDKLLNRPILSQDEEFMGVLSDIYIHSEKMRVMAVELGRSFFEDLFTGRVIIPGNFIDCTENGIIISDLQLENSLHNTKGIINAIDEGIIGE